MKSTIINRIFQYALVFFVSLNFSAKENPGTVLLNNQPVRFLENKGQMKDMNNNSVDYVLFKASTPLMDLYITKTGLTYVLLEFEKGEEKLMEQPNSLPDEKRKFSWEKVQMNLKNAVIDENNILKEGASIAGCNYYSGNNPEPIHVKEYQKITIKNVYDGIDWVFYNSANTGFKYDFIIHPGADPSQIQMVYTSLQPIYLDKDGNLQITSKLGKLTEFAPQTFFKEDQTHIKSHFKINTNKIENKFESTVSFSIDERAMETNKAIIIDPQMVWSTFYGGSNYQGPLSIDSDTAGNVFICGYSTSIDFPFLNAGTYYQDTTTTSPTAFVLKFTNAGVLLWSTYLGEGYAYSLSIDNSGNVFIVGSSTGVNFPLLNSGSYFQGAFSGATDAFILKFDNTGNLLWSTYYGGSDVDHAQSITMDNQGNIFVSGITTSTNFPVQNAGTYFQGTFGSSSHGFILKFDNLGNRLWATYYEKLTSTSITADKNNNIYLTGGASASMQVQNPGGSTYFQSAGISYESYILKFDNLGNRLWATYLGGSNMDESTALVTDKSNNLFITGYTTSQNFPVLNAGSYFQPSAIVGNSPDTYILKFNPTGTLLWGTYFGGTFTDYMERENIDIDSCGNIYLGLETNSANIPLMSACEGGYQQNIRDSSPSGNPADVFITKFSNNGHLMWATYLGGQGYDHRAIVELDKSGNIFVTGEWIISILDSNSSYPLMDAGSGAYFDSTANGSEDCYIVKFKNNFPSFGFSYPQACIGGTTQIAPVFNSSVSLTSQFTSAPGLSINPQTGVISVSASIAGSYVVSYGYPTCNCSTSSSVTTTTVVIKSPPPVTITGSNTICIGTVGTRTATGASTYSWSTGATTNTISLQSNSNMIVSVTGTASNGCAATATALVKVNSCVGTTDFEVGKTKVSVYANPNQGKFTVQSDANIELYLVNILGQEIQKIILNDSNDRKIVVNGLSEGIYFIKNQDPKEPLNYKIVVQK